MNARITCLTAIATAMVLAGCGDDGTDPAAPGGLVGPVGPVGPGTGPDPVAEPRAALRRLDDGEAFFAELRGALVAQRSDGDDYDHGTDDASDVDFAVGSADGDAASQAEAAPVASGDSVAGTAADTAGQPEVTGTNVQEAGVDERDRVKVSGIASR